MFLRTLPAVFIFWCVAEPAMLQAQNPSPPPDAAAPVKQSIQRGLEYLRSKQTEHGFWVFERETADPNDSAAPPKITEDPSFNLGLTALAALAMVENGVLPSDPAIQKAYAYVKEESLSNKRTYNLGLSILLLTRLGSREDRPLVQRLSRRLIMGQLDSGGWSYDCPIDANREASRTAMQGFTRKAGMGDNSNTQFAVLGLWASTRAGAVIDEPLELVAKRFRDSQASSGGWDYQSTGMGDSNAMTAAGAYALTVAAASVGRKSVSAGPSTSKSQSKSSETASNSTTAGGNAMLAKDEVFQKAMNRIEQFTDQIGPGASPYYLWSIERLGVTLQTPSFGKVDWYAKGKHALLESQKSSGAWEVAWKGPADTAFALLFLRKAHLGRDISYALTGDASKPFVLLGNEKPEAFEKLHEAVAAAKDGNTIEIHGHGPFDAAGITCEGKSLKIRCGDGFEPVLVHKLSLLQDAERDSKLRYLAGVQNGSLSLEGLRLQMDPDAKRKVNWAMIAVHDGNLEAVNCSFTQSNSTSVAGIEMNGGSNVTLQNCAIIGFSRAIDAVATGEQELKLENCLVYSRVGLYAKSAQSTDSFGFTTRLNRTTFHVGEVMNVAGLNGPAIFETEGNVFHTNTFSTGLRPSATATVLRKWDGKHNLFDLTRWLASAGQAIREVRDLDSWRKYWKTKEEGSFVRSAPFAVRHEMGPFRHNTNPNDWRLTMERLSADLDSDVQVGCDSYLVGAGQAYFQFRELSGLEVPRDSAAITAAPQTPTPKPPPDDAMALQGTWVPTDAEFDGQKFPAEALMSVKMILTRDQYTVHVGETTDRGSMKIDVSQSPKTMDLTGTEGPNKDMTFLAIYELNGDELKICYALGGGSRPTAFETKPNSNMYLAVYKRQKP